MKLKTIILITGPTASGKTDIAIRLAQKFSTEIISADSRQCFRELNIGVAKPTSQQLNTVKHHFINSHSIEAPLNAVTFEQYALAAADEIFQNHDVAVLTGGTGLYIKAFLEGLDDIPLIPTHIRNEIISNYEARGLEWLHDEIEKNDPVYFADGEMQNPQRMMRALEVKLSTGRSIKQLHQKKTSPRNFNTVKFAIELPREQLYSNINQRVHDMMEIGLLDEVKSLVAFESLNALQTVGYSELFEHLNNKSTLHDAVEKIKTNTRHYAKRQMTWFKKDPEIKWLPKEELLQAASAIKI